MGKIATDRSMRDINATLRSMCSILQGQIPVEEQNVIYGFHIDGDESDYDAKITYLQDAVGMTPVHMDFSSQTFNWGSWGNAFFIPKPCMLKYDGTVDYYLNPMDYTQKEDGTQSDVANTAYEGNAMMEWGQNGQRIYYKIVPEGEDFSSASVYIANYQADPDYKDYAFRGKTGKLLDHFYTPCYFGTIVNDGTKDILRSLSGQSGANRCKNKTAAVERTMAQANGEAWDLECYADIILIQLLLILMGKSTHTQKVFGEGLHTSGSDAVNDAFVTGQHDKKGLFYGTNSGAAATYTNAVKVFGMENWWGYMWRRFNGLVNVNGLEKYKMTYSMLDSSTVTDYAISTSASAYDGYISGSTLPAASGTYIQKMAFDENQYAPITAAGTSTTDYCDGLWTNNSQVDFAYRGGASAAGALVGAFYLDLDVAASRAGWHVGAAPAAKPEN